MAASAPTPPPAVGNSNGVVQMPRRRRRHVWRWIIGFLLLVCAAVVICVRIAVDRAEPILRTRVIETLRTRFKSRVELATFRLDWRQMRAEVRGFTLHGTEAPGKPPLLHAQAVTLTLKSKEKHPGKGAGRWHAAGVRYNNTRPGGLRFASGPPATFV